MLIIETDKQAETETKSQGEETSAHIACSLSNFVEFSCNGRLKRLSSIATWLEVQFPLVVQLNDLVTGIIPFGDLFFLFSR